MQDFLSGDSNHEHTFRDISKLSIPVVYKDLNRLWEFISKGTHNYQRNNDSFVTIGDLFGSYGDAPECFYIPETGTLKFAFPFKLDYALKKPEDLENRLQQFFGQNVKIQGTVLYFEEDNLKISINFSKQRSAVNINSPVNNAAEFTAALKKAVDLHRTLIQAYFEANDNQQPYRNTFYFSAPDNPTLLELKQYARTENKSQHGERILTPISETGVTFDMIIGQREGVSKAQQLSNMIKFMSIYQRFGAKLPKGILLYGPPGTGKTMIAKAIAQEAASTFVNLDFHQIMGQGLVGQAEQDTQKMFNEIEQLAQQMVVVVFIDEADKMLPSADTGARIHETTGNRISKFAQFMDGVRENSNIVFILSTNDPQDIDKRILSRMSDHLNMPLPDEEELQKLMEFYIKMHTAKSSMQLFEENLDIDRLAKIAFEKNLSGRDVRDLLQILTRNLGDEQLKLLQLAKNVHHQEDKRSDIEIIQEIFNDILAQQHESQYSNFIVRPISTEMILRMLSQIKSAGTNRGKQLGFAPIKT